MAVKTCTGCGKRKRLADFYLTKRDGHMGWCKQCCSEHSKGRYKYARREPEDGIACAICGVKRLLLAQHLVSAHGLTAREYRERFGLPTAAEILKEDARQRVAFNERLPDRRKRQARCARGHLLRGKNVVHRADGQRQCRTCLLDGLRDRYAADPEYAEGRRSRNRESYNRKMKDPEWRERERERKRERMQKKRQGASFRKRENAVARERMRRLRGEP